MFPVPVTFYFEFDYGNDRLRPYIMSEFARYGAEHLVLSKVLIDRIIAEPGIEDILLKEMADNGLSFCDAHAPYGPLVDMNCPWQEKKHIVRSRLKLALEICAYMKVDTITMHLGNNHFVPASSIPDEEHIARMEESLAELLPIAEKLGITICIENIWFSVNTPDVLNRIKSHFPTDALGFCYDAGHANIMDNGRLYATGNGWNGWRDAGKEPVWEDRALEKMLPNVVNCHLHDNNGWRDEHTLPGKGKVNWAHIMGLLKTAPRLKAIQSEVLPVFSGTFIKELVEKFDELVQL
ncbi:MAG: sugar phosphate isomerase/epimerase [Lentisphaeria bacterium]|nr:sugar phosphate isomerase/epimerase [Lentisphaeria bacterium]